MKSKVKVGFSLDRELLGKIDAIIEASRYLEASISEELVHLVHQMTRQPRKASKTNIGEV